MRLKQSQCHEKGDDSCIMNVVLTLVTEVDVGPSKGNCGDRPRLVAVQAHNIEFGPVIAGRVGESDSIIAKAGEVVVRLAVLQVGAILIQQRCIRQLGLFPRIGI